MGAFLAASAVRLPQSSMGEQNVASNAEPVERGCALLHCRFKQKGRAWARPFLNSLIA